MVRFLHTARSECEVVAGGSCYVRSSLAQASTRSTARAREGPRGPAVQGWEDRAATPDPSPAAPRGRALPEAFALRAGRALRAKAPARRTTIARATRIAA